MNIAVGNRGYQHFWDKLVSGAPVILMIMGGFITLCAKWINCLQKKEQDPDHAYRQGLFLKPCGFLTFSTV